MRMCRSPSNLENQIKRTTFTLARCGLVFLTVTARHLQVRNEPQDVVHLIGPLLRLYDALRRGIGRVDVDDIQQVDTWGERQQYILSIHSFIESLFSLHSHSNRESVARCRRATIQCSITISGGGTKCGGGRADSGSPGFGASQEETPTQQNGHHRFCSVVSGFISVDFIFVHVWNSISVLLSFSYKFCFLLFFSLSVVEFLFI